MVGVVLWSVLLQLLYKRQREKESMEVVQTVDKGRRLCMEWTHPEQQGILAHTLNGFKQVGPNGVILSAS